MKPKAYTINKPYGPTTPGRVRRHLRSRRGAARAAAAADLRVRRPAAPAQLAGGGGPAVFGVAQVQAVVRACQRAGVPFVARGHGTGLSGGALPAEGRRGDRAVAARIASSTSTSPTAASPWSLA